MKKTKKLFVRDKLNENWNERREKNKNRREKNALLTKEWKEREEKIKNGIFKETDVRRREHKLP